MNKADLIQGLIGQLNNLEYKDENVLDAFQGRSKMIVSKVFPGEPQHVEELTGISFSPMTFNMHDGPTDHQVKESWELGKSRTSNLLNTFLAEIELSEAPKVSDEVNVATKSTSNKIFIVHGHNEEMKQSVARTIEQLDLEPIILHEQPNKGRTVIEKFEDYSDVDFAVVLLSPDDKGYSIEAGEENAKSRARQNVILELGFFLGKLGRGHVLALFKEEADFEIPSDYAGVVFVPYDEAGKWRFDLVRESSACGYKVDANKII
ncbi:hypothetical protein MNBD_NITROSPINAE04-1434 [hydrothermal vent metagenome]|uniref:CD-NTase-associated protein 12/Pycsar effector protein TIR domain-containing protein n=1 Tax=hydrothermal vent metagenome TaxID=652676 RepID=A0A3B1CML9_9ZZZZ